MLSVRVACAARIAWVACAALALLPASASAGRLLIPSASWHGRAIQEPHHHDHARVAAADVPRRWSAGAVGLGTGFHRPGGSVRVRELQHRLRALGYRPGPVDGLFGSRTRAAVAWFQVKHGLPVTGRATLATVAHLRSRTGAGFGQARGTPDERVIAPRPMPAPQPRAVPASAMTEEGDGAAAWPLAALALLLIVLLVGAVVRPRRRVPAEPPHEPHAVGGAMLADVPAVAARPGRRRKVLAYVLIPAEAGDDASYRDHADAIEAECAEQGLALAGLVSDHEDSRLEWQRPGLHAAVERLVSGEVDYLMVTRLADPARSGPELQRLVKATENEIAIARWQRTPVGREHAHG